MLLDVSHTCHSRARTGIQRVTRSLAAALRAAGEALEPVTWDPYARAWRTLVAAERGMLERDGAPGRRGAAWPVRLRVRGWWRRALAQPETLPPSSGELIVPEVFSPAVAAALPRLLARVSGPRIAVFHDAIALRLPHLTPGGTVARFPAYLRELLAFDGVAAVSEDSRRALLDWWAWLGVPSHPPVIAVPLGVDPPLPDAALARTRTAPLVVSVGTLEGRKNHLALLGACETLWSEGLRFELRLVGRVQPETGGAALRRLRELQALGRPLELLDQADDRAVAEAYHACAFTVYPSLMEGFGLPVIESLSYGKPCVCSGEGALGESARGGGCIAVEVTRPEAIAAAMRTLLAGDEALARLRAEARDRRRRTWNDVATDLRRWLRELPRRTGPGG